MVVDEFKNLGFAEGEEEVAGEQGKLQDDYKEKEVISRLEELRRENEELKKRHGKAFGLISSKISEAVPHSWMTACRFSIP